MLCATVRRGDLARDPAEGKRGRAAKDAGAASSAAADYVLLCRIQPGWPLNLDALFLVQSNIVLVQSFFSGMDIPIWPFCCGFSLPCDGLSAVACMKRKLVVRHFN